MEQTNHERPSMWPTGLSLEMSKDPFGIMAAVLGKSQNGDDDGEDTGKGPEDGSGL